ncbi:MAG: BrnT family toxin [Acetobacteraceae bacterium]
MDRRVAGFERDQGNIGHCRIHGVSHKEIEELFALPVTILPDTGHSQTERRFRAIGRTRDGRAVFLVFTIRERDERRYIRPLSARYMRREEIESYEKENPDLSD